MIRGVVSILAVGAGLAGAWWILREKKVLRASDVRVKSAYIERLDASGIVVSISLEIENRSSISGTLQSVFIEVFSSQKKLGEATSEESAKIPVGSKFVSNLTVNIPFSSETGRVVAQQLVNKMLFGEKIIVSAKGRVTMKLKDLVPVESEFEIDNLTNRGND